MPRSFFRRASRTTGSCAASCCFLLLPASCATAPAALPEPDAATDDGGKVTNGSSPTLSLTTRSNRDMAFFWWSQRMYASMAVLNKMASPVTPAAPHSSKTRSTICSLRWTPNPFTKTEYALAVNRTPFEARNKMMR